MAFAVRDAFVLRPIHFSPPKRLPRSALSAVSVPDAQWNEGSPGIASVHAVHYREVAVSQEVALSRLGWGKERFFATIPPAEGNPIA